LNRIKNALKSAAKVFLLVFALSLLLLAIVACYLTIRLGSAGAYAAVMEDSMGWVRALILAPTLCAGGDILGSVIDRLWRPGK
jgi:hypothetical protein